MQEVECCLDVLDEETDLHLINDLVLPNSS